MVLESGKITAEGVESLRNRLGSFNRPRQYGVGLFNEDAPRVNETLRVAITDKNRQYFRRYRPLNTFYYTGGRNKSYGYLDFLPAMRNFDIMAANRDRRKKPRCR